MNGMAMGGGTNGTSSWCAAGSFTPMFMGFAGATQNGACALFLFPEWPLDTAAKYAFAWVGTVALALSVAAVAYVRRKHVVRGLAHVPALRRALDSALFAVQVTAAYCVMLLVMTYSGPLLVAAVLGLTLGHAIFADYAARGPSGGEGGVDATCCVPPEASDGVAGARDGSLGDSSLSAKLNA